jgi:ABC-type lipoprotein release transport system permease subunit
MTQVLMAMRIAHRALQRNTLRSTFTMLGVIIGVAAVLAMLAIRQGAQAVIRTQIASLGSHSLIVQPGSTSQSGIRYGWGSRTTLRAPDVQAIFKECPTIAYATPSLRVGFQVMYANQNWPTAVQGTGVEYGPFPYILHNGSGAPHPGPLLPGERTEEGRGHYFRAYGLIGVPTALVTGSGGATSRNS